jgi:hypothetical protein
MNIEEAENKIIEEFMPKEGEFIEFVGWNCHGIGVDRCDECRGWDGRDRRCDCENRRVCWVVEDGIAYGEAY